VWSLIGGFVLDTLALDSLGVNALALLPVVIAGVIGRRRIFLSGVLFPMILTVFATLAYGVVLNFVRRLGGDALAPMDAMLRLAVLQALMNAVLVPIVWPVVGLLGSDRVERMS
ncbi:MAG: rod shape-determining protein MreD, partial [Thermomicrobiales bacterium]